MISQLTVYLLNKQGSLKDMAQALNAEDINMHALVIADTRDYGIIRIISDTPAKAAVVLTEAGFRAQIADVIAVRLANKPGSLAQLLAYCNDLDIDIQYGYCFQTATDQSIFVLKTDKPAAELHIADGGFEVVSPDQLYATE